MLLPLPQLLKLHMNDRDEEVVTLLLSNLQTGWSLKANISPLRKISVWEKKKERERGAELKGEGVNNGTWVVHKATPLDNGLFFFYRKGEKRQVIFERYLHIFELLLFIMPTTVHRPKNKQ